MNNLSVIVKTGGKQYQVQKDSVLHIERLDAEVGQEVSLNEVLLVNDGDLVRIGAPYLENTSVIVEILEEFRGEKVIIFKKRRRQNYRRKNGHRQDYVLVKVKEIKTA